MRLVGMLAEILFRIRVNDKQRQDHEQQRLHEIIAHVREQNRTEIRRRNRERHHHQQQFPIELDAFEILRGCKRSTAERRDFECPDNIRHRNVGQNDQRNGRLYEPAAAHDRIYKTCRKRSDAQ